MVRRTPTRQHADARVSLQRGARLGNYVVEKQIGTGGQADVYLAIDSALRRKVALKVFQSSATPLLEEARMIATLDHPNVVRVYHVETEGELPYMAIEYMSGGSLEDMILRSGPVTPVRAIRFAMAMADGLKHAHALGVVHRDIKPKNLLVSKDGQLKIADFGFAFRPSDESAPGIRGTPKYMPPEVWLGQRVTPRSDVYSAGACLAFMVTGRAPLEKRTIGEMRDAHLWDEVERPDGIPNEIWNVVMRCMAKEPSDRPASATMLHYHLRQALEKLKRAPPKARARGARPLRSGRRASDRVQLRVLAHMDGVMGVALFADGRCVLEEMKPPYEAELLQQVDKLVVEVRELQSSREDESADIGTTATFESGFLTMRANSQATLYVVATEDGDPERIGRSATQILAKVAPPAVS